MLVDFMALAPYYFRTAAERLPSNLASVGVLRALRIIRIFRVAPLYMHMVVVTRGVFKQSENPTCMRICDFSILFNALRLGDYASGAPLFFTTLRASLPAIMVAIIAMLCMTMMFGTATYVAERGTFMATPEYPDGAYLIQKSEMDKTLVEGAHTNIFMSMWYVISDTTTSKCPCGVRVCVGVLVGYALGIRVCRLQRHFEGRAERWDACLPAILRRINHWD